MLFFPRNLTKPKLCCALFRSEFIWTGIGHEEWDWPKVRPHPMLNQGNQTQWTRWLNFKSLIVPQWQHWQIPRICRYETDQTLHVKVLWLNDMCAFKIATSLRKNPPTTSNSHTNELLQRLKTELSALQSTASIFQVVSVITLNRDTAWCDTNRGQSFRNSRQRACGVSDVDRDQLLESQPGPPLMLQQLCLLRPHIPAGQAHFTLITCADLREGRDLGGETSQLLESKVIFLNVLKLWKGHKNAHQEWDGVYLMKRHKRSSSNKHRNPLVNLIGVLYNCHTNKMKNGRLKTIIRGALVAQALEQWPWRPLFESNWGCLLQVIPNFFLGSFSCHLSTVNSVIKA